MAQAKAQGQAQGGAQGEVQGRRRFERRDPTAEEQASARERASTIADLSRGGLSFAQIGRQLKLPVSAVEAVVAESRAGEVPEGATRSPPTIPPLFEPQWSPTPTPLGPGTNEPSEWTWVPSAVGRDVMDFLSAIGCKGRLPWAIVKSWELGPQYGDAVDLERLCAGHGLPPEIARSVGEYLRRRSGESKRGRATSGENEKAEDPIDAALRDSDRQLADELKRAAARARIAQLNREIRGEAPVPLATSAAGPSAREAELTAELKARDREDLLRRQYDDRIRVLEGRGRLTLGDIDVAKGSVQVKGAEKSLELIAQRVEKAPHVLDHLDRVIEMAERTPLLEKSVQNRVIKALVAANPEMAVDVPTPTPDEAVRMAQSFGGPLDPTDTAEGAEALGTMARRMIPGQNGGAFGDGSP
ncbi:MAG: hypothetical protein ACLP8V_08490 [Thermoplasmata archaeon]